MTPAARMFQSNTATSSVASERRAIPFDYAFRFELEGEPGRVINSVVTVSIEATFTAVSIGYGVVPDVDPIVFGPAPPPPPLPSPPPEGGGVIFLAAGTPQRFGEVTLGQILQGLDGALARTILKGETGSEAVFKNGFKLNPQIAELALQSTGVLTDDLRERLFQVVGTPSDLIQFKYALFDEGSGREFQSEPILNIAGLGSAAGERPFRHFAQPITFRPRSTIRMEVTEVSDFKGVLHVALQGYKVLGDPDAPTGVAQRQTARVRRR
jgi:hypothetical protein